MGKSGYFYTICDPDFHVVVLISLPNTNSKEKFRGYCEAIKLCLFLNKIMVSVTERKVHNKPLELHPKRRLWLPAAFPMIPAV